MERASIGPRERHELLSRLRGDAARIASHFGLNYRDIQAEHPRVKDRYGVCYSDGLIKVRLTHAKSGEPLRYSSLIDTLCHELAHLRHFNHGPEFKAFFWEILGWARREGIYRPTPRGARGQHGERAASRSQNASPPLPAPDSRNGVPIFVRPEGDAVPHRLLPLWNARAGVEGRKPSVVLTSVPPNPAPSPRRAPRAPVAPAAQLALPVAAPPAPAAQPRPRTAPRAPRAPSAASPTPAAQLSLF